MKTTALYLLSLTLKRASGQALLGAVSETLHLLGNELPLRTAGLLAPSDFCSPASFTLLQALLKTQITRNLLIIIHKVQGICVQILEPMGSLPCFLIFFFHKYGNSCPQTEVFIQRFCLGHVHRTDSHLAKGKLKPYKSLHHKFIEQMFICSM